jgi:6-phosphofructokinase 2
MVYASTTDQQFRFGMPGPSLGEEEWGRMLDELSDMDPKPDYVVASGSLPSGVPKSFYGRVAALARAFEAQVIVDTSGEPLLPALYEGVFLIKPNLRELSELVGEEIEHECQHEEKAKQLVDNGQSKVLVVSRGAGGALVVWSEGHEHVRAPTVPIKSRVGAGDSMVAGIVLSLARGNDLLEAVRFGIAAGSAAVMTPGSELCRREDAEQLYAAMVSRTKG